MNCMLAAASAAELIYFETKLCFLSRILTVVRVHTKLPQSYTRIQGTQAPRAPKGR